MRSRRRGRWRRTDLSASPKRCTGETEGVGVSPWGPPSGSDGSGLQGRILAVALSPPPAGSHVAGPTRHNAVFVRVSEQGSTIVPRGCPSRAAASSTRPIMAACRLRTHRPARRWGWDGPSGGPYSCRIQSGRWPHRWRREETAMNRMSSGWPECRWRSERHHGDRTASYPTAELANRACNDARSLTKLFRIGSALLHSASAVVGFGAGAKAAMGSQPRTSYRGHFPGTRLGGCRPVRQIVR
jgi:hypothetical protein